MYLGGMGGTGKSQVIKALISFFNERNESHRFMVLAPTGTAAALLNGFTYHRALGIFQKGEVGEDFSKAESSIINEVRARLQGVLYIFVDEVSMIACHELYKISARLAQIANVHDVPFGGFNVIFAGDFAQLPPVFGSALYDQSMERHLDSHMSVRTQETVIGKILWHQITTVVILKQNMRQKTQSSEDQKLRTALENMRYTACTPEDIEFLRSRIAGRDENHPKLNDEPFRNVSVITARNVQKDRINNEGAQRFASDHGAQLVHFYSSDRLAGAKAQHSQRRKGHRNRNSSHALSSTGISKRDQEALWECDPYSSDGFAGKLSLCVGMPVMIRHNGATELCITKGQEAVVVGWDEKPGLYGRPVLETLFVRLVNPPKDVSIENLPMNVVPITPISRTVECQLKSDRKINIHRLQVPVLLNFSMTDYSSQGKTCPVNVVDLGCCATHMSYYTCLSRSASAEGTVLVQGFSEAKITGGISGWLRQEFRELNILDEVTKLKYEGTLPEQIFGPLRNPTIRAYYLWIKDHKNDVNWHPAIRYAPREPRLMQIRNDATWDPNISMSAVTGGTKQAKSALKRKVQELENVIELGAIPKPASKVRRPNEMRPINGNVRRGLIWDHVNYSCAYNTLFTVLYNIWIENPSIWARRFVDISDNMSTLSNTFMSVVLDEISLEAARDTVRARLAVSHPNDFPTGARNSSIDTLCLRLLGEQGCGHSRLHCQKCGHWGEKLQHFGEYMQLFYTGQFHDNSVEIGWVSQTLGWHLSEQQKRSTYYCPSCRALNHQSQLKLNCELERMPYVMCILLDNPNFYLNKTLNYSADNVEITFHLRGVIYLGSEHFVSRVISDEGIIWFHDGITTRSTCIREGQLDRLPDDEWLRSCARGGGQKKATVVVYARS